MKTIPLHRTTILRPFTLFLSEVGVPFSSTLQQVKLPSLALDDPDCYISSLAFWAFVEHSIVKEDIKNLGFLVGEHAGASAVSPHYSKVLSHYPTLYYALQKTCSAVAAEISHSVLSVSKVSAGSTRFCHKTSFGIEHPNHHQMEWFAIMSMIGIVQEFTGSSWYPREIGLMSYQTPACQIREYFPNSRFLTGQNCGFISIETHLLSLPALIKYSHHTAKEEIALLRSSLGNPADEFIGSLKQLLQAYLREGTPRIALAAEMANTSVRSLQRELSRSSLSYLDLLEQIRFETAKPLLSNQDIPVNEIAYRVGYTDASHFARAFRRFTGISPTEFRKVGTG